MKRGKRRPRIRTYQVLWYSSHLQGKTSAKSLSVKGLRTRLQHGFINTSSPHSIDRTFWKIFYPSNLFHVGSSAFLHPKFHHNMKLSWEKAADFTNRSTGFDILFSCARPPHIYNGIRFSVYSLPRDTGLKKLKNSSHLEHPHLFYREGFSVFQILCFMNPCFY